MKILLRYLLLLMSAWMSAQTMAKNTVSNAGIEMANPEYTISFTIGEPVVGLITNGESIDQGFWAGSLYVEPMAPEDLPITPEEELGGISVYPNPVAEQLHIQVNNNKIYGITLYAVNGKMALKQKVESSNIEYQIDLSHLARGMYVLRLSMEGDQQEKLFKIIKR